MLAFAEPLSYPLRVLPRQRLLSPFWPDSFPDELSGTIVGQAFDCAWIKKDPDLRSEHYKSVNSPAFARGA
jgi:hypothetical protein